MLVRSLNQTADEICVMLPEVSGYAIFDKMQYELVGYSLPNGGGGYNRFDLDLNWIGFWCSNGIGGYNGFDTSGRWINFVVM